MIYYIKIRKYLRLRDTDPRLYTYFQVRLCSRSAKKTDAAVTVYGRLITLKILAADDEAAAMKILTRAIREAIPAAELQTFMRASEAVDAVRDGFHPDVAFLDIVMPGMTGLEMAAALKTYYPPVNIVFVTGDSQYAGEAFNLRASGYVNKPATPEKIAVELENLRNPLPPPNSEKLCVQCFGNFEVYRDGVPLSFPRTRDKEVLAYLVLKRGGACSMQDLAAILYEDEPYSVQQRDRTRKLVFSLSQTLQEAGAPNVLVKRRNSVAVDPDAFDCDYYRFLDMDIRAINAYTGEFMAQYEWAVFTTGFLDRQK